MKYILTTNTSGGEVEITPRQAARLIREHSDSTQRKKANAERLARTGQVGLVNQIDNQEKLYIESEERKNIKDIDNQWYAEDEATTEARAEMLLKYIEEKEAQ